MKKPKSLHRSGRTTYILFIIPALLIFVLTIVIPFIQGIGYSLTDWNGVMGSDVHFVGLKNYADAFKDQTFRYSAEITAVYAILNFLVINLVSFALALIVSSRLKLRNIYRAGFFLPNLIGGLVLGYIWKFIFNTVFLSFGGTWFASHPFLNDPKLSIAALIMTSTWQSAGYYMMIYFTALQNVPQELTESSELDGAGWWQRLKSITIPMIMPTITVVFFLTLSSSFQAYDVIVSLTGGGPSTMWHHTAVNATELLTMNIYNTGSVRNNMALAQAKAVIFFIALAVISYLQTAYNRKKETEL